MSLHSRSIVGVADDILRSARIELEPVPVFDLARSAGATLRMGPLPDGLSGFLLRKEDSVIIGVNSLHAPTRQRFTVAHELGHLKLHRKESFVDHRFDFRDHRSSTAEDKAEIEANQFAANLLMPEWLLGPHIKDPLIDIEDEGFFAELARKFQVSPQALVFRLMNLGRVRSR